MANDTGASRTDFAGKVALVTGAGSGIGRAAAELFAARGAAVAVVNRSADKGLETVERIRAAGGTAAFIQADLVQPEAVPEMMAKTLETFGALHCAFNNAGMTGRADGFLNHTLAEWNEVIAVNLTSVFLCMQHQIRHMLEHGGGAIVNNGSGASIMGAAGLPHYTATKHGVSGITKVAAKEFSSRHVRINTICPGVIDTGPMRAYAEGGGEAAQALLAGLPNGRMGTPEEVARAAVWLCSDDAVYVSGVTIPVDGGFMCL